MTTVTIRLPPETEQKLREKATRAGESLETFLQALAEQAASAPSPAPRAATESSPEQRVVKWWAWVDSQPPRPVLADDSRESIYEGQGG